MEDSALHYGICIMIGQDVPEGLSEWTVSTTVLAGAPRSIYRSLVEELRTSGAPHINNIIIGHKAGPRRMKNLVK
ncbi:hypothetical protein PoB_004757900 [Plakobranchus ocellatus]|uniref:Uncharacterized protein n=1 Tax=Plakobranchus ocellatus TaxID=259542 RepID=A0AAV4BRT0_9GAST|nr:hypothetical protein PoB_004757900 [Plakobranchus ocellatus]